MNDKQWQVVWELFEAAIKLEPGHRHRFVESASGDGAVVKQALALLEGLPAGAESHLADRREGESWPQLGRTFGRYVVTAPLARGGMGEVYCGHDTVLGRRVALKFLISPPPGSDRLNSVSDQARLIREAQAASALDHPNIVTVHEVIQSEDTLAIVTEFVEGRSLRELCGAPLPLAQVIDIVTQIAKALAAAHGHGIVHRDVKPENVMLRSDGYVKMLDFGLARQLAGNITSTAGLPAGTLRYMSPEQVRAESVSAATDVFSLGIVVYELATGEHPFEAGSLLGTTDRIAHDEPALPSKLNALVTPTLDCLIMAMLAKQPSKRPSAPEVGSRLTGMIETGREGAPRRVKAWLWVSSLAACVVCGVILWAIAAKIFAPKEPLFEQITAQASENSVTAAALSPNGEEVAFGTLGGQMYVRRMSGFTRPLSTPRGLQVDRLAWFADSSRLLASGTIDQRAGVWVIPLDGGAPSLIAPEGRDGVPSPDGTRIALTSADGTAIWVIGLNGDRIRQIRGSRGTSWFSALIWSPDGKRISYERREYAPPKDPGSAPAQLPLDYAYAYEATDVNSGRVVTSLRDVLMTSAYGLEDGRVLFVRGVHIGQWFASLLCEMRTDLKTGEVLGPIHQLPQRTDPAQSLGLSSISAAYDGSKIAVVGGSEQQKPNIYIADLPPGKEVSKLLNIRRLTFIHAEDYPHAWTPDSDAVIFESSRDGPFALLRQKIDEQEPEPLVLSKNADNVLAQVSPDGKWVLYREDRENGAKTRFMRVPMNGGTPEPLPGTENVPEFRCGLQSGSRCVLRSTENDQFVFYELDPLRGRGRELARTAWSPTGLADWDISPDGRFAAMPNHDPQTATIRIISLDATRADAAERVVTINGMKNLNGLFWAANGEGWYVVEKTPLGLVMFYVDADGAHSWELLRSSMVLWAVPSPDGRKIAFPQDTPSRNVYLVKGFR